MRVKSVDLLSPQPELPGFVPAAMAARSGEKAARAGCGEQAVYPAPPIRTMEAR